MFVHLPLLPPYLPTRAEVYRLMGYPSIGDVSLEVREVVGEQLAAAGGVLHPWAGFDTVEITAIEEGAVELKGGSRLVSPALAELLAGCRAMAVSLVTIGPELEEAVSVLSEAGDPVAALALDAIGSAAVEAIQRALGKHLCGRHEPRGLHVTRHYAPGYAGWDLAGQEPLFGLLRRRRGHELPVTLNDYAMMWPRKSLSAVWGLSPAPLDQGRAAGRVPCRVCDLRNCSFRRAPYVEPRAEEAPSPAARLLTLLPMPDPAVTQENSPFMNIDPPSGETPIPSTDPEEQAGQNDQAARPRVHPVRYAMAPKALGKWMRMHLTCQAAPDGAFHYAFRFLGSTCSNGGVPINAELHAIIREKSEGMVFENGWIEVADDHGLRQMCEYHHKREAFVEQLRQAPPFCGQTLEQILESPLPVNPAGCFCKPSMVNHKWRQMVSTIHYALWLADSAQHEAV